MIDGNADGQIQDQGQDQEGDQDQGAGRDHRLLVQGAAMKTRETVNQQMSTNSAGRLFRRVRRMETKVPMAMMPPVVGAKMALGKVRSAAEPTVEAVLEV
mmetsp:Transcript_20875/g.51180  ORF Transcript_20875/g.51180 Transcript_20875/m.51180 type:complete len:100 (-) Transcript_20875:511-810(-)